MQLLCDADANGAEVAQYEVYLPEPGKKLMLCNHHMQVSWPAMQKTGGIVALRIDAVERESCEILSIRSGEHVTSTLEQMQEVMMLEKSKW